jgi:hypothetical protein
MKKHVGLCLLLAGCAGGVAPRHYEPPREFPEVSQLPANKDLPDPLVMMDGRRVTSAEMWEHERKPELKALFQHYMYGILPPVPPKVTWTVERIDPNFFGGKATKKEIAIRVAPEPCPTINLLLVVPNQKKGPAPVFLGINFTGNHALVTDPSVALPTAWMRGGKGEEVVNSRATEKGRGKAVGTFALEQSIDRGYAVATWYYGDGLPDKPDYKDGIYPYIVKVEGKDLGPTDCGAIAIWAWTFHRCIDYLVTDKDLDPKRIAVTGHSRNGKASLVAAAFDDRIALAIPHQAGCGGTAPSRCENPPGKMLHETVARINTSFPHWFCGNFKKFNDQVERLPFDQNCLAALCAPRPILFTNGVDDQWANPTGQFEMLRSASSVYELLGSRGLDAKDMPPLGALISSPVGYYIRTGPHVSDPEYWKIFLDFADRNLKAR